MRIVKRLLVVAVAAVLVAGGAFGWFRWQRAENRVSHRNLTGLEAELLNATCEMCHPRETDLYRGNVKVNLARPAWKGPVTCTDCHDFASNVAVSQKCVECHTAGYVAYLTEWTTGFDEETALAAKKLGRAESALARGREGVLGARAERLVREGREALEAVKLGLAVHHPDAARALLAVARGNADKALDTVARR